jgi:hypothetical protein
MSRVPRAALALGITIAVGCAVSTHTPAQASNLRAAPTATAAVNPCSGDNLSPSSRTLAPVSVFTTSGTVTNPANVLTGGDTRLTGSGSAVTLDFGKDVGGLVTLHFAGSSDAGQSVGLAFSESSAFVGNSSDASNGGGGADGAIYAPVSGAGSYAMPGDKLRGGFRYLTLFLSSGGFVDLNGVSLAFTAAPGAADPAAYPDYFCSNDSLLDQIWYAGAYTVQLDTIDPAQGRVWPAPSSGWENNGLVGAGTEVLVDGAKRDRSVWPGDMGVSTATAYVSTDDMTAVRNSLTTMYQNQKSTGELPYGGPQFNFYGSDTYHMWTLAGTYNYYLYTGDRSWLNGIWGQYQQGVNFVTAKIDGNGLLNVTGTADWARGGQGGENIEANALLYQVLTTGSVLAGVEGNSSLAATYSSRAASAEHREQPARQLEQRRRADTGVQRQHLALRRIHGGVRALRRRRRHERAEPDPDRVGLHARLPARNRQHLLGGVFEHGHAQRVSERVHEPGPRLVDRRERGADHRGARDRTHVGVRRDLPGPTAPRRSHPRRGHAHRGLRQERPRRLRPQRRRRLRHAGRLVHEHRLDRRDRRADLGPEPHRDHQQRHRVERHVLHRRARNSECGQRRELHLLPRCRARSLLDQLCRDRNRAADRLQGAAGNLEHVRRRERILRGQRELGRGLRRQ